jgi:hypothetical protein
MCAISYHTTARHGSIRPVAYYGVPLQKKLEYGATYPMLAALLAVESVASAPRDAVAYLP